MISEFKNINQINTTEITDNVTSNSKSEEQEKKPNWMNEIKIISE